MKSTRLLWLLGAGLLWACSSSDGESEGTPDSGPEPADASAGDADGGAPDTGVECKQREYPFAFNEMCFAEPTGDATRTQCGEIVENCDESGKRAPALTCWSSPEALPDGPSTVALAGYVDVFSSGPDADGLTVEVYDYDELQQAVAEAERKGELAAKTFPSLAPLATDTVSLQWSDKSKPPSDAARGPARACPADKKSGLPCVVPAASCGATQPYCDLANDEYCHVDHCEDRLRWEVRYRVEGIPTNRRLVIRTRGKDEFDDGTWGVMLLYSAFLRADAPGCAPGQVEHCVNADGDYELEINAISRADYATIPITAGLAGGIPEGHGAISGEVRDCDEIKLEAAQVATSPSPSVLVYFNGNPIKTLPDLGRFVSGTNIDGLFAALDLAPGAVRVGAVTKAGGAPVGAGTFEASVLPDSVTVVAVDGPDPTAR